MNLPKMKTRTVALTFDNDVSVFSGMYALVTRIIAEGASPVVGTEKMTEKVENQQIMRTFSVEVEKSK